MKIVIDGYTLDKDQLLDLINSGNKLVAIKMIKELTDLGLKECKDIVDNLSVNPNHYDLGDNKINADYMSFAEETFSSPPPPPPPPSSAHKASPPPPPPVRERQHQQEESNSYSTSHNHTHKKPTKARGYLKDKKDSRYNVLIALAVIASIGFILYVFFK